MDSCASSVSVRPTLPPLHTLDLPRGETKLPHINTLYASYELKRQVSLAPLIYAALAKSGATPDSKAADALSMRTFTSEPSGFCFIIKVFSHSFPYPFAALIFAFFHIWTSIH